MKMENYFFKIELIATECPYIQEGLQPNSNFGGYWCKHPSNEKEYKKNAKVRCNKLHCPIKKR